MDRVGESHATARTGSALSEGTLDHKLLLSVLVELSAAQDLDAVVSAVRDRARDLVGCDGVTFVLREGDQVFYRDENAIAPLWKGRRFPASECISGWAIEHKRPVVVEDIYADPRVPCETYRPTFVKSLIVVPIRTNDPIGAIGAYWATRHRATSVELEVLQGVADATALAIHNAELSTNRKRTEQELRHRNETTETLLNVGRALASELDQEKLVQLITDEATKLCGAEFGAFFHNLVNERGESYVLYTLSGAPREKFSQFPLPRNTAIFEPTFSGSATVRLSDVTRDPRYGKNAPYHGMPKGHLPVRSYLAVPVKSRSGAVLGGLFFGHSRVGMFTEEHERLTEGLAMQGSVALDNATLYRTVSESERKLRLVTDNAPVLIAHCDRDARYKFVNKPYAERFGLSPEDVVGKHISEIVGREGYATLDPYVRRVLKGEAVEFEVEIPYEGLGAQFMKCGYVPEKDHDGAVVGFVAAITNVTERKRADEARARVQRKLETISNNATVGLLMLDERQHLTFINPAGEKVIGFTFEECEGKPLHYVIHPTKPDGSHYPIEECPIARALSARSQTQGEDVFVRRDGSYYPVAFTASPIIENGKPVGTIIELRDITSEKEAEKALRQSEERFRHLAESIPQMAWENDPDGSVTYLNKKWYDYTGQSPEEALGWGWKVIMHPDDAPATTARWMECLRTGDPVRVEYRLRRHDGVYRWHLTRALPSRNEAGRIVGWFGTCTDIDDQKRAEEALKEADRRKDEFLAMLAHELRNPLAPITTSLHLAQSRATAREDLARPLAVMARQTQHLTKLVDDLLEVSRITRGKIRLEKQALDSSVVVNQAVELSRPVIDSKRHDLQVSIPHEPLWIDADATRMAQVLGNLLNNAAKYTDVGGRIWLTCEREGREAVFRVRDTGIGISRELLPRLFQLFTQGDTSLDRSQGGLGIGLTLVRGLVELHGGSVQARSDGPGQGCEFIVRLPLTEKPKDRTRAFERLKPADRRRIVIVDDNLDAAESLAEFLTDAGHEVKVAYDGPSSLEAIRSHTPNVVILDIGLPRLDGYEVARQLRREHGDTITLVALTGYGQDEDRRRTKDAGFDHHFVKPVQLEALSKFLAQTSFKRNS